jgi:hypothetical protein
MGSHSTMSRAFFADVADALRGFLPRELREFHARTSSRNVKIWYGEDAHEHYEVQVIGRALEVGFHCEYPARDRNAVILERIDGARRALGRAAESGAFHGRPSPWMRLSELWKDGDVGSPEAAIEAAERLAEYVRAIEPLRVAR